VGEESGTRPFVSVVALRRIAKGGQMGKKGSSRAGGGDFAQVTMSGQEGKVNKSFLHL